MIEVCTCSREELPEEFAWAGVNNGKPGIFIHYIGCYSNGDEIKKYLKISEDI